MAEYYQHLHLLRHYELRLLRCTTATQQQQPPPPQSHAATPLLTTIIDTLDLIEAGRYAEVLSSDATRNVFRLKDEFFSQFSDDSVDCADRFYSELMNWVDSFLVGESVNEAERGFRTVLVMCVAVSAFLGFTQCHLTGLVLLNSLSLSHLVLKTWFGIFEKCVWLSVAFFNFCLILIWNVVVNFWGKKWTKRNNRIVWYGEWNWGFEFFCKWTIFRTYFENKFENVIRVFFLFSLSFILFWKSENSFHFDFQRECYWLKAFFKIVFKWFFRVFNQTIKNIISYYLHGE